MSGWLETLRTDRVASTILVLFIPSVDRYDEPIDQDQWVSEALEENAAGLREFLHRMGRDARQGAVGLVIDRDYLEIRFRLEEDQNG